MDGKQAIIDRILEDATKFSDNLVNNAKLVAEKTENDAEKWANDYSSKLQESLKQEMDNIIVKKNTLAKLEAKKKLLNAKQELVNEVFNNATLKLMNMPKNDYLAFVEKLITKNAEMGECVVLAKGAPISALEVKELSIVKKLNLSVKENGLFKGGIVLEGNKFDKKLSFDAITENLRDVIESEIAKKLFD